MSARENIPFELSPLASQLHLLTTDEIIVDNFAGGGGASTGLEMGLGRYVDIAINHDAEAIAMHKANHPQTEHYIEDVFQVDPREACRGRPVGLVWLSPDCKHHSKAKGGKPREKKIRGLAWVGVKWAGTVSPRVMMLENVEEFRDWGPLIAKRCPKTGRVVKLDETVAVPGERVPLTEQYLVPDKKRRGQHFNQFVGSLEAMGYQVEHRELRACDYGAPTTRKRLFLIARRDGQPIVWPAPTHGDPRSELTRLNKLKPWRTAAECIDWSLKCTSIFERDKPLADATLRRIARGIVKYVLENGRPYIVKVNHSGDDFRGQPLDEPLQAVTSKNGYGVVDPELVLIGKKVLEEQASRSQESPLPFDTIVDRAVRHAVEAAALIKHYGGNYKGPGVDLQGPMHAITTVDHHALIAAHLTKFRTGSTGADLRQPMPVITAGPKENPAGAAHALGLVTANLVRQFGNSDAAAVNEPMGAVMPGGSGKTQVVTSHLLKLRHYSDGQSLDGPIDAIAAGGQHFGEVRAFLVKYYGEGGQWADLNDPMHTLPTKDRMGLVTVEIDGETYAIADIGMRMLEPHELYAAQGFPTTYRTVIEFKGKRLAKHARVRMCGNSVSPVIPAALARANCPELAVAHPQRKAA
jgi:DNA (cytosine-5)-methyltransferase 1